MLLSSAAITLAACSGGSGGDSSSQTPNPVPSPTPAPPGSTVCGAAFLGNASAVFSSSSCIKCQSPDSSKAGRAIDNDAATAAEMDFSSGGSGTIVLRATTQSGTVVAAGNKAGVLIQYPAGAVASESLDITTFLAGQQQERVGGFSNSGNSTTTSTPNFFRYANTKPYDRIEVTVTRNGDASTSAVRIIEVCSE
jgi:hypothetical protein